VKALTIGLPGFNSPQGGFQGNQVNRPDNYVGEKRKTTEHSSANNQPIKSWLAIGDGAPSGRFKKQKSEGQKN
jgi:hypothetical protein